MPLYDFRCTGCAQVTEHLLSREDARPASDGGVSGLLECPTCGGALEREIVPQKAPSFALKGEGWAADGYAKKPADT